MRTDSHTDAADFRPLPLAGTRHARVPVEQLDAAVERLFHERAGDVPASTLGIGRAVQGLARGRVQAANRHLVDAELLGGLGDHALDDSVRLHGARRTLLGPRRGVGQDVDRAPAHGRRLVDQRRGITGRSVIAHRAIRPVVLDDEEIQGEDAAIFRKADSGAAGHVGARAPDVAFFFTADAHHHRRVGLLRQQRGNRHRHRAAALAAKAAARVFGDQHQVLRLDADPARHRVHRADHTLGGAVQVQLAVLPERHRAARLERVVPGRRHDEGLVEDQVGGLERGLQVAERPFLHRLAHRHAAFGRLGKVRRGPLEALDRGAWGFTRRGRGRRRPHVALAARVGAIGPQALDRIGHEGQRLDVEMNQLDRLGGNLLADGRHGENRLTRVERLVGQAVLGGAVQLRHIVGRDDGADTRQRHRASAIDAEHARVRALAEHQLAEEHAVGAKVFGVARAAGDLGDDVRRDVVGAHEPLCHRAPLLDCEPESNPSALIIPMGKGWRRSIAPLLAWIRASAAGIHRTLDRAVLVGPRSCRRGYPASGCVPVSWDTRQRRRVSHADWERGGGRSLHTRVATREPGAYPMPIRRFTGVS